MNPIYKLSREEIRDNLKRWFQTDALRTSKEYTPQEIEQEWVKGHVIPMPELPRVLVVGNKGDSAIYETLRGYIECGRVFDTAKAKFLFDCPTSYRLKVAVEEDELMRFTYETAVIYID